MVFHLILDSIEKFFHSSFLLPHRINFKFVRPLQLPISHRIIYVLLLRHLLGELLLHVDYFFQDVQLMLVEAVSFQNSQLIFIKLIQEAFGHFGMRTALCQHVHDDFAGIIDALRLALIDNNLRAEIFVIFHSPARLPLVSPLLLLECLLLVFRVQVDVAAVAPFSYLLFKIHCWRDQGESCLDYHSLIVFRIWIHHLFFSSGPLGKRGIDHVSEVV